MRTNQNVELTILASGSEVSLACEVSHKLATENTHSKVISVPCHELFDKQLYDYKEKILNETKFKISIEAGTTDCWKKYVGENGLTFGVNNFGKSAPHKKIYEFFNLTCDDIMKMSKKIMK